MCYLFRPDYLQPHSIRHARVGWLCKNGSSSIQVSHLRSSFSAAGLNIVMIYDNGLSFESTRGFDLLVFESSAYLDADIRSALTQIRVGSRAPLVLLTVNYSGESKLNALRAGADAIFPISVPSIVILAHCRALLRRWFLAA